MTPRGWAGVCKSRKRALSTGKFVVLTVGGYTLTAIGLTLLFGLAIGAVGC